MQKKEVYKEQVEKFFSFSSFMSFYKKTTNSESKKKARINFYGLYRKIAEKLIYNEWEPLNYSCFLIKDKVVREVFSPHFEDRIVHHLIVSALYKIDDSFIDDSYANRKGKGTHKAIRQLQYFMRQYTQSECSYMQCDIKSYFVSIDKKILLDIINKQIDKLDFLPKDREFLYNLIYKIISQDATINAQFTGEKSLLKLVPKDKSLFYQDKGKGRPIGSQTSQFESLIYLNELDWFIKNDLKIKHYIRYVDDFVLLTNDVSLFNEIRERISLFLKDTLKLVLHPKKTKIQNISKGINFLGYIVRPHYILVRKRTVNALKDRLRFFNWLLNPEKYDYKKVKKHFETNRLSKMFKNGSIEAKEKATFFILRTMLQTINSYYGIFSFSNSYNLRRNIYTYHFEDLKEFFIPKNSFGSFILKPNFFKGVNAKCIS